MIKKYIISICASVLLVTQAIAAVGDTAPDIQSNQWINGEKVSIPDLKGKVVVLDFFQLWCPGCNSFTKPLLTYWHEKYSSEIANKELVIIGVHTVYEGHSYQTFEALRQYIAENQITHLIANDLLVSGHLPETMKSYETNGTPEVAIIDKDGIIRFQKFGFFDNTKAEQLIDALLES